MKTHNRSRIVWKKIACAILAIICVVGIYNIPIYAEDVEDLGQPGDIIDGSILTEDMEATAEEVFEYEIVPEDDGPMLLGIYLASGRMAISNLGNGKAYLLGRTTATSTCDKVEVAIYLQQYKNGCWNSYKNWNYSTSNVAILTKTLTVSVPKGYYYRIKGYHAITKGSTHESCMTYTNGIKIS